MLAGKFKMVAWCLLYFPNSLRVDAMLLWKPLGTISWIVKFVFGWNLDAKMSSSCIDYYVLRSKQNGGEIM